MPREKGKEWDYVTIIELKDKSHQLVLQACLCRWCFPHQRALPAHLSRLWIAKCTADEAVLQLVLDEMRAIDVQNKAAAGAAAAQRQHDRSTAAIASTSLAPAKQQPTLAEWSVGEQ